MCWLVGLSNQFEWAIAWLVGWIGQPVWLVVSMSVYAFLAAGVGYVAGSNTDTETEDDSELGQ